MIENNGGVIVCLDDCSGERTNRLLVDENAPDILRAISDRYLSVNCSVMTSNNGRLENTAQMIRDYQVDLSLIHISSTNKLYYLIQAPSAPTL